MTATNREEAPYSCDTILRTVWVWASILLAAIGSASIAGEAPTQPATVLDRLWIWTHPAGAHDGIDLGGGGDEPMAPEPQPQAQPQREPSIEDLY